MKVESGNNSIQLTRDELIQATYFINEIFSALRSVPDALTLRKYVYTAVEIISTQEKNGVDVSPLMEGPLITGDELIFPTDKVLWRTAADIWFVQNNKRAKNRI